MLNSNPEPHRFPPVFQATIIDVIVAVRGGLVETRDCLASLTKHTQTAAMEIVVISSADADEALSTFLHEREQAGDITLLKNTVELGSVNALNRGLVLHPDRDVVLLDGRIKVHGDWLDRLCARAYSRPDVGAVMPFSNEATLCGYPRIDRPNSQPDDWPLAVLDTLFANVNAGLSKEIPAAVGGCVYVTRRCLLQIGYLDSLKFTHTYEALADFSELALERGFAHLLCADVYVYCSAGAHTSSDAGADLSQPALYVPVIDHSTKDSTRHLRRRVDFARILHSRRRKLLFVTHSMGGGTEKHVQELATLLKSEHEVLVLRPADADKVSVQWLRSGEDFIAYFSLPYEYSSLLDFVKDIGVQRIHFHHSIGLPLSIMQLPQHLDLPYEFTLHDYYPICPQYTLSDENGRYCGEPDTAGCNACLAQRPAPWGMDILSWRTLFDRLLTNADRVIAPSQDTLERVKSYIPNANFVHLPHPETIFTTPPAIARVLGEKLKILILGRLSRAKGLDLLEACAIDAKVRQLPLYFRVLGSPDEAVCREPDAPLSFSGLYSDLQLPILIEQERADIIFFPAQWPETYSYTLSYAMHSGLPIAAPRLGAFSERLANYSRAWLLNWDTPAKDWNDFFVLLLRRRDYLSAGDLS